MSEHHAGRPVRVVIVDDTKTIRAMIRMHLARVPGIEVVGEAGDPFEAREMIRALNPDVITLDVVMPRMDGLSFLERLMRMRPMPVIMVSTRTTENSAEAIAALSLGAFDCVDMAALNQDRSKIDLAELVLAAATSQPRRLSDPRGEPVRQVPAKGLNWNGQIVLMGSSTGGVEALTTVLSHFPTDCPPTLIAQHMPASFLQSFAQRLDGMMAPKVALATDGEILMPGKVLIAAGGSHHLTLAKKPPSTTKFVPSEKDDLYVPSINVLFSSAVYHASKVVGVLMTGMGRDGAQPLLDMRNAGAHTIVQDAASSVVDGMPKAARELGAAVEVASLDDIAPAILAAVTRSEREPIT